MDCSWAEMVLFERLQLSTCRPVGATACVCPANLPYYVRIFHTIILSATRMRGGAARRPYEQSDRGCVRCVVSDWRRVGAKLPDQHHTHHRAVPGGRHLRHPGAAVE